MAGSCGQSLEVLRKHAEVECYRISPLDGELGIVKPWFDSTRAGMDNKIEIEPSPLTFQPKTLEWSELEDVIMDALDTAHHGAEPITLDDGVPDMVAIACITVNALKDAGIVVEG